MFRMLNLILVSCLFFGCEGKPKEKILVVGLNATYPPYESYDESGTVVGFDIDLAKAIAQKLDLDLVHKDISFDALILSLKQSKIDLLMSGMSITESRQKEIAMIPYQGESIKELTLAFWKEIPETAPKHIAVQVGTFQEGYLLQQEGIKVKSLDGTADLILDLQFGKCDAALFEPHIAQAMKKKFPDLILQPLELEEKDWVLGNGIGIKKENHELIEKVETVIQELKKSGTIQTLEKKWFGESDHVT